MGKPNQRECRVCPSSCNKSVAQLAIKCVLDGCRLLGYNTSTAQRNVTQIIESQPQDCFHLHAHFSGTVEPWINIHVQSEKNHYLLFCYAKNYQIILSFFLNLSIFKTQAFLETKLNHRATEWILPADLHSRVLFEISGTSVQGIEDRLSHSPAVN